MCFVTYLPYQDGFILTSNRDEMVERPRATPPKKNHIENEIVFYPQDAQAGGTWFASSEKTTVCLLNGAFQKHQHRPPYKKSRGLVVLDYFKENDLEQFVNDYEFSGIEPFTLIIVQENALHELRWDEAKLHTKALNPAEFHSWSSVTLYNEEVVAERNLWFEKWQNDFPIFSGDDIINFHTFGGKGDVENDLLVNRNDKLKTVSITQVTKTSSLYLMSYDDQLINQKYRYRIL